MIRLHKIKKQFDGKQVLKSVDFEVNRGDFKTIIGRIGSGKSTIINLICGLLEPDMGQIFFEGKIIKSSNREYTKRIGYVLSTDYLIEDFSTILYWRCIGKLLNLKRDYIDLRINYLLDLCNISDPEIHIGSLSSGNKMLVKFGTMLLHSPDILIIDEPFIHLDIKEINKLETLLKRFNENGITILMTTHSAEPLYRIGKDLLLLEEGIIKEQLCISSFKDYNTFYNTLFGYFIDDEIKSKEGKD